MLVTDVAEKFLLVKNFHQHAALDRIFTKNINDKF